MKSAVLAVLLGIAAAAGCEPAPSLSGPAIATDGDSLEIGETRVRLHAIDAPEADQSCWRGGVFWGCGTAATERLQELVDGRTLTCRQTDIDTYGRTVAVCRNGAVDLGAEIVLAGLARAYTEFGDDYVREEAEAKAARRGIWAWEHDAPWDHRRNPRPAQEAAGPGGRTEPSDDCRIKGNINRDGVRIYHVPGTDSYEDTIIDPARGERWFCAEAEARNAGWRPPRR